MSDSAKADVLANLNQAVEHFNGQNAEPFVECFTSTLSLFGVLGGLHDEISMDAASWQAQFDAGYAPNVSPRHVDVEILGDTALLTGYMHGTIATPDGTTVQGPWRLTTVYIKEADGWKARHNHWSKLLPGG